nr:hypothetical protein TSUD_47270 [Ipomoea trifida]
MALSRDAIEGKNPCPIYLEIGDSRRGKMERWAGWVLPDEVKIGQTNNFSAEVWGLREGHKLVRDKCSKQLDVELDSKAMVKEITNGVLDCGAFALLVNYRRILVGEGDFKIFLVLRECNKCGISSPTSAKTHVGVLSWWIIPKMCLLTNSSLMSRGL